ncbi:MAG: DMT family transporter [Hyphomicrobiales bacterium]
MNDRASIPPTIAYFMVFIGVLGHGSSEFFAVLSGVNGAEVSVWRYVLGAAGLLVIALIFSGIGKLIAPMREMGVRIILLSFFGVSLPYLAFHWALDFASIVQVGTLVTTIPIFVGLCNLVINKQPISTPKLITGAAAVAGVALLLTDGYLAKLAGDADSLFGIFLSIACAFGGSAYAVLAKPHIGKYGALPFTTVSMTLGAIGLWVVVGIAWGNWVNPFSLFDKPEIAAWSLLILGFWNTTITQILWFGGLAAVPDITRGSYLFFLKPVITAGLALLVLSQPISFIQALAIIIICGAVVVEMAWPWISRHFSADAAQ